jgi:flagellar FliL protein
MAAKEPVRDDDEDGDDKKKVAKAPAGPMKLVIVGAVAVFIAVLGAQVVAPLVTNMISGKPAAHKASAEEGADGDQAADESTAEGDKTIELAAAEKLEPALYVPLDPPFVVSFESENGETRFVQLTLQAMARSEKTIEAIKQHAPAIRNSFLFLISGYKVEELSTLKGKERLRAEMLVAANQIMEKNTGSAGIEELYFTSLVIQ